MITIRMPKESLEKWIEALESGEYRQGKGSLCTMGSYCCLGVLQSCVMGDVERQWDNSSSSLGLPSMEWLGRNKIQFARLGPDCRVMWDGEEHGFNSPYLPDLGDTAHGANDSGISFKDIAAAIRLCSEAND